MTQILHVSCSPRGQAAESERLAQKIIGFLLKRDPSASVVKRVIGAGALSHIDADHATALGGAGPMPVMTMEHGSLARSEALIQELENADVLIIGTPMHNYTVPSTLKAWIDHIVRDRRTFYLTADGKIGALRDRPVFVAVASGGRYSGSGDRQPDFLTPYLKAVLGMIGLHDLTFFSIEGTGYGPKAVAEARRAADRILEAHFSSYAPKRQETEARRPVRMRSMRSDSPRVE
jgi:FMN-dependent NADH-azoreductase